MVPFCEGKLQGSSEGSDDLRRRCTGASLLQADHVVDRDPREVGELLPAQSRRSPGPATRQPGCYWRHAVSPQAQSGTEFRYASGHLLIVARQRATESGTAVPTVTPSLAHVARRAHAGLMTNMDTAAALTRLLDEAAIRDATARFADTTTNGDYDGFRSLWADDADWVIGATEGQPFDRRAHGVDDIVSLYRILREARLYFVQFAVQGSTKVNGDDATARCICHEAARRPGESYYRNHGVWSDRLRRSGDGWVFTSRTPVPLARPLPLLRRHVLGLTHSARMPVDHPPPSWSGALQPCPQPTSRTHRRPSPATT